MMSNTSIRDIYILYRDSSMSGDGVTIIKKGSDNINKVKNIKGVFVQV